MTTIEALVPAWRTAFLKSRNSLFTPVSEEHWEQITSPTAPFPVKTWVCRDESQVLAWSSFYLRHLQIGAPPAPPLRLAQACAIGTLPGHQRKGLGRKVWLEAERDLASETDGILVYTGDGGSGYGFYRSLGYLPLAFPPWLRCPAIVGKGWTPPGSTAFTVRTVPFTECPGHPEMARLFAASYRGHAGHLADRPASLAAWSRHSFFFHDAFTGATPQLTWTEDPAGRWLAYAIWAGPMGKIPWKRNAVEIWELACGDAPPASLPSTLRGLLQPAFHACPAGAEVHWWGVPGHPLTRELLDLGFDELPRGLCVLGKLFDPARHLAARLRAADFPARSIEGHAAPQGGRLEIRADELCIDIEPDAAQRLLFARSDATAEHRHGLLAIRPSPRAGALLPLLDRALPPAPWAYLGSEFI